MYVGKNDNSEVDIHKLMNVVKHIREKWQLVGISLQVQVFIR